MAQLPKKLQTGLQNLQKLRESDVVVGCTPKEEVFRLDHVRLYRYAPERPGPITTPLLISYAMVNRPYMVDLQEDRSLVRNLLARGIEVYLVDWGYPGPLERWVTLDDYIDDYLDRCIDEVRRRSGKPAVNVLGICQGGALALTHAALHPEKVKNLITMVAPVDFHVEAKPETGLLNAWIRGLDADEMVDALGNVPGDLMNFGYLMLRPFSLNLGKYLSVADIAEDETKLLNFLRMEKWIFDSPDQPGEAFRKFVRDYYQHNRLVNGGLEINGREVRLKNVRQPVLNIYAEQDHLVPPASSKALEKHVGTQDYTERGFRTGHIGMYVSGKVQRDLPELVGTWLEERDA
jgi:polyhydroxyalkanoate synthase